MRQFIHVVLIFFYWKLSTAAAQDSDRGVGWERFEFNKDAPLDDEEVEGLVCWIILLL